MEYGNRMMLLTLLNNCACLVLVRNKTFIQLKLLGRQKFAHD